jgi:hypothetical protein
MKLQFRVLAGLFALIAFSLSVVEGVWASTCMPTMAIAAAAAGSAKAPADCDMDAASTPSNDSAPVPPAPLHCPLTPMGASGSCTTIASLPIGPAADLAPAPTGVLLTFSPDQTRDLLLVNALFHPPKA